MNLKLIIIILFATLLRLVLLTSFPAGLNADEAALGYNAYSLLITGKDEHGHPWPVNLESFGDFKPALYSYILIPFIKVLGLTELAVRLPSALFGILAILLIYLLSREIFENRKVGLFAAFFLAVSPWHLHFSRGGWEANVATTFLLLGAWTFIKWAKTSSLRFLLFSILGFVLSMYCYQSTRLLAPVIGLGFILIYRKFALSRPQQLFVGFLVLIFTLLPLIFSLFTSNTASRLSGVGLFADIGPINRINELRGHYPQPNSLISRLLHNKVTSYSILFIKNYTDHFNPTFLFISGDEVARSKVPETGQLYLTDLLFLVLGAIYLLRYHRKPYSLIWLWLIIAPLASALTFQTPSALRSHNLIIPLTLISASGLYYLLDLVSKYRRIYILLIILLATALTFQISRYLHQYYVHYPQTYPAAWEYGFKQLVPYVESIKADFRQVIVTDFYDQPYILFLFYSQYPPQKFQTDHQLTFRDKFNFSTVRSYANYQFTSTPWDKVRDSHSTLIVAAPGDIPPAGVNIIKTIYFPNGQPAFELISN